MKKKLYNILGILCYNKILRYDVCLILIWPTRFKINNK